MTSTTSSSRAASRRAPSPHAPSPRAASGPARLATAAAAAALVLVGLLAGCSASSSSDNAGSVDRAPVPAVEGKDAGGSSGGSVASVADDPGAAAERQVVQTGSVAVTVADPRAAADRVVAFVEGEGGRVDDRSEQADQGDGASAQLTVRVPAATVSATIDHLRGLGKVGSVDLKAQDVTGTAQDLDARIAALQVSVTRLEDLMARSTSTKDLLDAETTLSQRQSSLEELQAQRALLADQVALSTLTIALDKPGVVPAAADHPHSFWAGVEVGWQALVAVVKGIVVVLGVLLPWLAFGGALAAALVALVRWLRRRRPPATPTPVAHPPYPLAPAVAATPPSPHTGADPNPED